MTFLACYVRKLLDAAVALNRSIADLNDLHSHYDPVIKQIAELYCDDVSLQSYLQTLAVTPEEWDDGRGGGHLWFQNSSSAPVLEMDTIDAWTQDTDGMPINIVLHTLDGHVTWGEWFRVDGAPIQCWPPSALQRTPPTLQ